jgi:hypothetical protein
MPHDTQALHHSALYSKIVFKDKDGDNFDPIPAWANPDAAECKSCAECWKTFAKGSGRFSANFTEQDAQLDMVSRLQVQQLIQIYTITKCCLSLSALGAVGHLDAKGVQGTEREGAADAAGVP